MGYKIAIDGPAGAGKGYVAREVSKKLGIVNIDTGAMYRAFGLYVMENNIDVNSLDEINIALKNAKIDFVFENDGYKVFLGGKDVSSKIRTEQVAILASKVSCVPSVRKFMVKRQQEMAEDKNVVMEGRDIGSVVLKDANLKIFLTASTEERAKRRYIEFKEKGIETTLEEVVEYIKHRDLLDIKKEVSPLVKTEDMIEIDTTNLTKEEVVERIIDLVKEKGIV